MCYCALKNMETLIWFNLLFLFTAFKSIHMLFNIIFPKCPQCPNVLKKTFIINWVFQLPYENVNFERNNSDIEDKTLPSLTIQFNN